MRKILIIILFLLLFAGGIYFLKNAVGDIRPAVLPPDSVSSQNAGISQTDLRIFAQSLEGVRDLEFSPSGVLLASITASGKVVALKKNDGLVQVKEIISGLNSPHGIAFWNGKLYVAEETKLTRYNFDGETLNASFDKQLFDLPPRGNHFTRSVIFDKLGNLYVSVGSTCNVCSEKDERYAAVLISDAEGNNPRLFAKGLRNSVFMALNPQTGEIWATDMGRDFLGDNLPPDEVNILKDGRDYGWPNCYGNKIPDTDFNQSAECSNTQAPVFEIPAHSAPLGLAFDPEGNLLVAYHGSWNRSVPDGYKVVRMKVSGSTITEAEDLITGFLKGPQAMGRPVDLIFDKEGNLYISDDKAGLIYKFPGTQ